MRTYPIILVPGIARFDIVSLELLDIDNNPEKDDLHYFRGIRNHLRAHDFDVWHANVNWAGRVVERSRDLKAAVERFIGDSAKVHIIAHSMGGLDARRMLFDGRGENLHHRVASLTTIGTPHHGSPAADAIDELVDKAGVDLGALGIDLRGIQDLTTDSAARLNQEISAWEDNSGVAFNAYAGKQKRRHVFSLLQAFWRKIDEKEGDNDGMVSVRSARWKDEYFRGEINADHLNELAWWDWRDGLFRLDPPWTFRRRMKGFYLSIAEGLAQAFPLADAAAASG